MHLVAAARVLVLSALLAPGPGRDAPAASPSSTRDGEAPPATAADGAALVRELGCAGCHTGLGSSDLIRGRAPALGSQAPPLPASFVFGYLADPRPRRQDIGASRMPDFGLDEGERLALALFLGAPDGDAELDEARRAHPGVDATTGRRIYGALGCGGCHTGIDGPMAPLAPDLNREGARARSGWLRAFLSSPDPVRGDGHPDLGAARMPDFRLAPDETEALALYLLGLGRAFADLDETRLTPFDARRTERLLEDRLACLGCHQVGERGGRIGPSLDGVSLRRTPSYVLEMILDPGRAAPGAPMPHQPLRPQEASRLARYLLSLPEPEVPVGRASLTDPDHPAWAVPASPAGSAEALYGRLCAACHGPQGQADGWNAPSLPVPPVAHADPALMALRADDTLYDGIFAGAWVLDGSPRMPAFGALLAPAQIRSLVGYIRTLCSCQGPEWSRDGGRR